MDDPQNGSPVDQGPTTSSPRDGGIDFGHYSLEQLQELQYTLDRHSFPQNFENLLRELQRRESAPVPAPPALEIAEPGRFTPRSGLLGWLQAKRMRQPVYGAGSLSVGGRGNRSAGVATYVARRRGAGDRVRSQGPGPQPAVR